MSPHADPSAEERRSERPTAQATSLSRRAYLIYAGLCALALAFTAVLDTSTDSPFDRFLADVNPLLAVGGACIIGGLGLLVLDRRFDLKILAGRRTLRGVAVSAGMATALAVPVIIADIVLRYPRDINVPLPESLLFYPTIGLVAEAAFHIVPLVLVHLVLYPLWRQGGRDRIIRIAIPLVALVEPIYQTVLAGRPFTSITAYTLMHVFVISLLQLRAFKRYDFLSMYSLRIVYYLWWHVVWGTLRLELLFS